MNSKTILIAVLCTFLLLMLPNDNAVEYLDEKEIYENNSILDYNFSNGIGFYLGRIKGLTENETHILFVPINIIFIFCIPYDSFSYWHIEYHNEYFYVCVLKDDNFPLGIIKNNFICAISNHNIEFDYIFPN